MTTAVRTPTGNGMPRLVNITPVMTAVNVIKVPTDRSIPPVMITRVAATARTPFTEDACRMAMIFDVCMKFGDARLKPINRSSKLANANNF